MLFQFSIRDEGAVTLCTFEIFDAQVPLVVFPQSFLTLCTIVTVSAFERLLHEIFNLGLFGIRHCDFYSDLQPWRYAISFTVRASVNEIGLRPESRKDDLGK